MNKIIEEIKEEQKNILKKYGNHTFDDAYGEIYSPDGLRVANYLSTGILKSDSRYQASKKLDAFLNH